jgi:pimeloyl-ACP methyl ester carboxylesterase
VSGFVLLHGAFRGGWSWDRVAGHLRDGGHVVATPDLVPAHAVTAGSAMTLDDLVRPIVAAVDRLSGEVGAPVTLAGHSLGGFLGRVAAEDCADRLSELVYLDAPVPVDGERAYGFPGREAGPPDVDPDAWVDPPPVSAGERMSADDARWITARLRPEPVGPSLETVRLDCSTVGAVPVRYLFFSDTPDFMPCAVTRARLDADRVPYDLIDAGHDGIVTAAAQVADWLARTG